MKKEKQIGVRVGLPAFFTLELEDVYRHTDGAHRALAFPDFIGLLVGMGLEAYRKQNSPAQMGEDEALEDIEDEREGNQPEDDPLRLFDMNPKALKDLFNDFDEAMEPQEERPRLHLVRAGGTA